MASSPRRSLVGLLVLVLLVEAGLVVPAHALAHGHAHAHGPEEAAGCHHGCAHHEDAPAPSEEGHAHGWHVHPPMPGRPEEGGDCGGCEMGSGEAEIDARGSAPRTRAPEEHRLPAPCTLPSPGAIGPRPPRARRGPKEPPGHSTICLRL